MNIKKQKSGFRHTTKYKIALIISSILLAAAITLFYFAIENTKKTISVPITKQKIRTGSMITPDKVAKTQISRIGLTDNLLRYTEDVVGKYALRDYGEHEYFFSTGLTDDYVRTVKEKARFGAIAVPISNMTSVNGEIKENDFIKIIGVVKNEDEGGSQRIQLANGEFLSEPKVKTYNTVELSAVRVLGIYDSAGKSTEMYKEDVLKAEKESKEALDGATAKAPSMLVLDVLPIQQSLLIQLSNSGTLQVVILPERVQMERRKEWGLIDDTGREVEDPDANLDINDASRKYMESQKETELLDKAIIPEDEQAEPSKDQTPEQIIQNQQQPDQQGKRKR